jgi:hypothetical protein
MYLMDDFCIMCNNVTVSALVPNKKGNLSRLYQPHLVGAWDFPISLSLARNSQSASEAGIPLLYMLRTHTQFHLHFLSL